MADLSIERKAPNNSGRKTQAQPSPQIDKTD